MKNTVTEELSELNSGLEGAGEKTRKKGQKNYMEDHREKNILYITYIYYMLLNI